MSKDLPHSIRENLQFLVAEVDGQLSSLQAFFLQPSRLNGGRIIERSGYAYNLKLRIHASCLNRIASRKKTASDEHQVLRGIELT
ncbi:MAG TPA: hypothetical protein VIU36_08900, partial [Gammaproteobacteria bacterium]